LATDEVYLGCDGSQPDPTDVTARRSPCDAYTGDARGDSLFARVYGSALTRTFNQLETALERINLRLDDVLNQQVPMLLATGVDHVQDILGTWLTRLESAAAPVEVLTMRFDMKLSEAVVERNKYLENEEGLTTLNSDLLDEQFQDAIKAMIATSLDLSAADQ
jgi:hypothetical protein